MSHYQFHYGGGLGDCYQQILRTPGYANLMHLAPDDTCEILFVCHNPFVLDFFKWHPKKDQIKVVCEGYWGPDVDALRRKERGLWAQEEEVQPPGPGGESVFYCSSEDQGLLDELKSSRIVVIQATAGNDDRNIPTYLMDRILNDFKGGPFTVVGIGRNYERGGRGREFDYSQYHEVVSLVDKLSFPGTIKLIQQAVGVIACHSCICLVAWHNRIPNILTLPKAINHINGIGAGDNNEWTFGLFYPETQLVYCEDYAPAALEKLLK